MRESRDAMVQGISVCYGARNLGMLWCKESRYAMVQGISVCCGAGDLNFLSHGRLQFATECVCVAFTGPQHPTVFLDLARLHPVGLLQFALATKDAN